MPIPIGPGIGIGTITGDQAPHPEVFFADILNGELRRRWPALADTLAQKITARLGAANLIADGFTLYDIGVALDGSAPTLSLARSGNGDLIVSCTTGRCAVVASSTQPTVFGKWADPRLRFTFALSFSFAISLPTTTQGTLAVSPLRSLRILQPDIDSMSIITDIAFFVDDLVAFVRGRRFVEDLQDAIAQRDFAELVNGSFLTDALAPVNATLADLWRRGFWYLEAIVDTLDGAGELLALRMPEAPPGILSLALVARALERTGVIEGTVEWPKSLGRVLDPQAQLARASWASSSEFVADVAAAVQLATRPTTRATSVAAPHEVVVPAEDRGKTTVVLREATPLSVDTPLAASVGDLTDELRPLVTTEALGGSRPRLESLIGAPAISRQLREIVFGTDDLVVEASVQLPGEPGQLFGGTRVASHLAALWADDDETTCRRHYRLAQVAVGEPVTLSVKVAPGHRWVGADFAAAPHGWEGQVTLNPPSAATPPATKRTPSWTVPLEKVTSFPGGIEVMLNPQPLPPKEGLASAAIVDTEVKHRDIGGLLGSIGRTTLGRKSPLDGAELSPQPDITMKGVSVVAAALRRRNPTGDGAIEGIDFLLQPYQAPIVR